MQNNKMDNADISRQNKAQLELIRELFSECKNRCIRIWLFGGWGVDALQGKISRDHEDIDIIAEANSGEALRGMLEYIGGEISINGTGWWFHKAEFSVDIGFILTCSDGTVVSDVNDNDPNVYPWPPGSFPEENNGMLLGLSCKAISWEAQYVAKAGYRNAFPNSTLRTKDQVDLQTIEHYLFMERRRELEEKWFQGIPRERIANVS